MSRAGVAWVLAGALGLYGSASAGEEAAITSLVPRVGHALRVMGLAFSPDGRFLATGSQDGEASLWEVASGRELRRFRGHFLPIRTVVYLPGGDRIATGSEDGTVRVWDVATGREVLRFAADPPAPVFSLAVTPDGRRLVAGDLNGRILVWSLEDGGQERSWDAHLVGILSLAVSPDGRLAASSSSDTSVRIWDLAAGREVKRWNGHAFLVPSVRFSRPATEVLSGGLDGRVYLWSVATGVEIRHFGDRSFGVHAARISPDGTQVLAVGQRENAQGEVVGEARLWNASTGETLVRLPAQPGALVTATFSPDGAMVAAGLEGGEVVLWEAASGREIRKLGGSVAMPLLATASREGRLLLTAGKARDVRLWDLAAGRQLPCFGLLGEDTRDIRAVQFSPDGRHALLMDDSGATLWSLESCEGEPAVESGRKALVSAALSAGAKTLLTGNDDGTATLWDLEEGGAAIVELEGHQGPVSAVALSSDGSVALTGGHDGSARLWSLPTGRQARLLGEHDHPVAVTAFSPDGRWALTATANEPAARVLQVRAALKFDRGFQESLLARGGEIRLWEVATGREVSRAITYPVRAAQFSSDSRKVLLATGDGVARCLEVPSGRESCRFDAGVRLGGAVGFLGDGTAFVTGLDGTVRLWKVDAGRELVRLVSFRDGSWAAVDRAGRFDASDPGDLPGLSWVVSDDPMSALPVEIFLREYFEPRLLARHLDGELFPAIRGIEQVNRVQPEVRIVAVEPEGPGGAMVRVEVEVAEKQRMMRGKDGLSLRSSGVKEVRLFRDGQLVAAFPQGEEAWGLEEKGRAILTFPGVRLPRSQGAVESELSAYAFNDDGVKSETVRWRHILPSAGEAVAPQVFLVHVGIDAFEAPGLSLRYAVSDARLLQASLRGSLERLAGGAKIVSILLAAERTRTSSADDAAAVPALPTKARIQAVLQRLAGKQVDPALLAGIPDADRLRPAGPDDIVVLTFSTHGETYAGGMFYLFPQDTGPDDVPPGERLISADDLSRWIREVDAGEAVIVLDTCRSAASIDAGSFKPGPMDSRSLGQLAYDKAMRILAASQADDLAFESNTLRHGLLTYSLVRDGIERRQADSDPEDGEITLGEWLRYGARRVPELYAEGVARQPGGRGLVLLSGRGPAWKQQPVLFDFARRPDRTVLAVTP